MTNELNHRLFNSAFNSINHQGLLYKSKFCGLFKNKFKDILTNLLERVLVDRNFNQFKPVVFGVPQGSGLGPIIFILYSADMLNDLENKIILYADAPLYMLKLHLFPIV